MLPLLKKGRRESRAPTAPAAPCAMGSKETHTDLTGTAETSRLSPRNGFTAYTCSPRGAAFLAPVAGRDLPPDVAPGSRRQDHTISPYAVNVSSGDRDRLTSPRPSQPAPTLRDDAHRPLWRHGLTENIVLICVIVKRVFRKSSATGSGVHPSPPALPRKGPARGEGVRAACSLDVLRDTPRNNRVVRDATADGFPPPLRGRVRERGTACSAAGDDAATATCSTHTTVRAARCRCAAPRPSACPTSRWRRSRSRNSRQSPAPRRRRGRV